jgi:hypothetical protein
MKRALLIFTGAVLASCASTPPEYARVGVSDAQRLADVSACQDQARTGAVNGGPGAQAFEASASAPVAGRDPSAGLNGVHAAARAQRLAYGRCMTAKGYVRTA